MGLAPGSTAEVSVTEGQKCLSSDRNDQSSGLQVLVIQLRSVKKVNRFEFGKIDLANILPIHDEDEATVKGKVLKCY